MTRFLLVTLGALLLAGCTLLDSGSQLPAFNCVTPSSDSCGENFRVTGQFEAQSVYGWNVMVKPDTSRQEITAIADNLASSRSGRRFVIFYLEEIFGFNEVPTSLGQYQVPIKSSSDSWVAIFDFVGENSPSVDWQD